MFHLDTSAWITYARRNSKYIFRGRWWSDLGWATMRLYSQHVGPVERCFNRRQWPLQWPVMCRCHDATHEQVSDLKSPPESNLGALESLPSCGINIFKYMYATLYRFSSKRDGIVTIKSETVGSYHRIRASSQCERIQTNMENSICHPFEWWWGMPESVIRKDTIFSRLAWRALVFLA